MFRKRQSALQTYQRRRGGSFSAAPAGAPAERRWPGIALRILLPLSLLAILVWALLPRSLAPLDLTYELDLEQAQQGRLTITLIAEGDLPSELDLEFPPGVYAEDRDGVEIHPPQVHRLKADGAPGPLLDLQATPDGWRVHTGKAERIGAIYRIDLYHPEGRQEDVRRHISAPINGGVRAAGFEIFLEPVGHPAGNLTVAVHNPRDLPFLVPWPALLRPGQPAPEEQPRLAGKASVGPGMGFVPAERPEDAPAAPGGGAEAATRPVAANLLYHPQDLADLNNSLIICGDISTATSQARDTVIRFATDRAWNFPLDAAVDLVRRIARTQIAFFGGAPTSQITVLLAANTVTAASGFDIYGLHTGASVLVMLPEETTWGQLEESAASVISHEMFHGWLGEAVRQDDPLTLWFTEGATTWYAARMLAAGGVWSTEHAREVLAGRLDRDYGASPLLGRMSVAEAASEVMAGHERVRFSYAGGVAACAALDEWLSRRTGMMRPLDEVLRALYEGRRSASLTPDLLEEAILEVTGVDCSAWLEEFVYGKSVLPPPSRLI